MLQITVSSGNDRNIIDKFKDFIVHIYVDVCSCVHLRFKKLYSPEYNRNRISDGDVENKFVMLLLRTPSNRNHCILVGS